MRRVNLPTAEIPPGEHPDGYRHERLKLAPLIGAATMTGSLYVLPPGQANCPYHYESDEEWLFVLEGHVTVRHPGGEDVLDPGDLPAVAVYPDSGKIGVWTEGRRDNSWSAATARSTTTTGRHRPCAT